MSPSSKESKPILSALQSQERYKKTRAAVLAANAETMRKETAVRRIWPCAGERNSSIETHDNGPVCTTQANSKEDTTSRPAPHCKRTRRFRLL